LKAGENENVKYRQIDFDIISVSWLGHDILFKQKIPCQPIVFLKEVYGVSGGIMCFEIVKADEK
jgi:hypothetical protein